jgi:apolipoprotein N-acyltransferase
VLQPAIPTREKFEAPQQRRLLSQLAQALRQAPDLGVEGLLLPEGSLTLGQPLPAVAGVEVLSGGFRQEDTERRSSLLRFPIGTIEPGSWLDKHRVVPLGEWVPFADRLAWAGLSAVGGITPGAPSRLLNRPEGAIGVAICYELADGAALAEAVREGARWLVASANLDPYPLMLQEQFRALARQRAIETGRWLLSAANTGPSLVIDPAGEVRQELRPFESGLGVMALQPRRELTLYDRFGEAPLLLLTLGAWSLVINRRFRGLSRGGSMASQDVKLSS